MHFVHPNKKGLFLVSTFKLNSGTQWVTTKNAYINTTFTWVQGWSCPCAHPGIWWEQRYSSIHSYHGNIWEWSPSNPTCFAPSVHYTGVWVGLKTRLDIFQMMFQSTIPSRSRFFSSPTGWDWLWDPPSSLFNEYSGFFPILWSWPLNFHLVLRLRMNWLLPLAPYMHLQHTEVQLFYSWTSMPVYKHVYSHPPVHPCVCVCVSTWKLVTNS